MSENFTLPSWTQLLLGRNQALIQQFNRLSQRQENFGDAAPPAVKAELLALRIEILYQLAEASQRWGFFLKSTGVDVLLQGLLQERAEVEARGQEVRAEMPPSTLNVLFLDTETTGLGAQDEPISLGFVNRPGF